MILKLTRPISFIDLETTGPHPTIDRVVQAAIIKVYPDGTENAWSSLVNPQMDIPPEATECHGITDADVKDAPTFHRLAPILYKGLTDTDIGGYNVRRFDMRVLKEEFKRSHMPLKLGVLDGRVIDAFKLFQLMEPRNLSAAVRRYLREEMVGAHQAPVDIAYTKRVVDAQLEEYTDLPREVDALAWMLQGDDDPNRLDPDGKIAWRYREAIINFGTKWLCVPLRKVSRGYLHFIIDADFSPQAQEICREALQGRYPVWKPKEAVA